MKNLEKTTGLLGALPPSETLGSLIKGIELARYVTEKNRLVILCSPSNPTGAVYRKAALETLGRWAVEKNFMILSDEVYEKLTYDEDQPHISVASLAPEIAEHTITIDSFSKSYAMTGWHVGFLTAPLWLTQKIDAIDRR